MKPICKNSKLWCRTALAAAFMAAWAPLAQSQLQAQAAGPEYALFQYSSLTGSGNTITASWVPVVTAAGTTIYKNITLQFNVDASGNLTLIAGYPKVIPAPILVVSSFAAGNYASPSTVLSGKGLITVSGPGATDGGATEWSLAASPGADNNTYPSQATWYVGALADSPLANRLKAAGITSTAWSYGVGGITFGTAYWASNSLLGFSQIGNQLTIVSFTYGGTDHSTPVDSITYTLLP